MQQRSVKIYIYIKFILVKTLETNKKKGKGLWTPRANFSSIWESSTYELMGSHFLSILLYSMFCFCCLASIFFLQIIAYINFERTVKRRILTQIFYSWSALKKIRPMFWSFSAIWISMKNRKLRKWEKWGWFQSFLERTKFCVKWNNYSYAAHYGDF